MLYREVSRVVGYVLMFFSCILLIPFVISVYFQFYQEHPQPHSSLAFLETLLISIGLTLFFKWFGKKGEGKIYRREGILSVCLVWLLTSLIGSLPFYLSGTLSNPIQAFFESASGFTTTGSTVMEPKKYDQQGHHIPILKNYHGLQSVEYSYFGTIEPVRNQDGQIILEGIDAVSRPLIFWRSLTQWLGGLGIMVLFVAILPALGAGGKVLFQSEITGPIKSTMTPRVKETALGLWKIYAFLTCLEMFLLFTTNQKLGWFDSLIISLSTLSTGGFSPHNDSLGYWDNPLTNWIVILFMILASINFSLYYYCMKGKIYKLWDVELITFFCIIFAMSIFGTYQLLNTPIVLLNGVEEGLYHFFKALTDGTFQLVSSMTSTGFYTANYDFWPNELQVLLLIVMFVGGMSGSTAGGIKIIRHILLFLLAKSGIVSFYRKDSVRSLKVNGKEIDAQIGINVFCFFFLIISISVLGTFLYSLNGIDPETSIGLTSCMINNIGLGFRQAGAMNSCAFLSNFSCLLSCLLMFLGRLEFIVILVLFFPGFWKEQ